MCAWPATQSASSRQKARKRPAVLGIRRHVDEQTSGRSRAPAAYQSRVVGLLKETPLRWPERHRDRCSIPARRDDSARPRTAFALDLRIRTPHVNRLEGMRRTREFGRELCASMARAGAICGASGVGVRRLPSAVAAPRDRRRLARRCIADEDRVRPARCARRRVERRLRAGWRRSGDSSRRVAGRADRYLEVANTSPRLRRPSTPARVAAASRPGSRDLFRERIECRRRRSPACSASSPGPGSPRGRFVNR